VFNKKVWLGAAIALMAAAASAQFTQDVGIEQFYGSQKFKAKNGSAQFLATAVVYYIHTNPDIKFLKKQKADALVNIYVSNDTVLSGDDRLVYQKSANGLKVVKPKLVKFKTTLTQEDKGKYILFSVLSPQSELDLNDVSVYQIPLDAY
jgi:hypothetical protein